MIDLLNKHKKFLSYTLLITFCSGIGQTYLLALFNEGFQDQLGLSSKELSYTYASATFTASLLLPFIGSFIDHGRLKNVVIFISLSLGGALFFLGQVGSALQLFLAYVLVRLLGQSSLPLCASATITKYFGRYRGKVLAFSTLGRSLAEGSLPFIVIFCLANYGLSFTLSSLGGLVVLMLVPTAFFLLKEFKEGAVLYEENLHVQNVRIPNASLKTVYGDYRVYLLALSNVTLPFVMTGIYFHNQFLIEAKSWTLQLWGESFMSYAVTQLISTFVAGYFVDKFGAYRVVLAKFVPLFFACIAYLLIDGDFSCHLFMALCGVSMGLGTNSKSSLMAELFGDKILATIKSVDASLMVISTSIAPIVFSFFFEDLGVIKSIKFLALYLVFVFVLLWLVLRLYRKK